MGFVRRLAPESRDVGALERVLKIRRGQPIKRRTIAAGEKWMGPGKA
jgi:hypothetical protein